MHRNQSVLIHRIVLLLPLTLLSIVRDASAHSDIFIANVAGQVAIGGANELGSPEANFELTTKLFSGVMVAGFPPFDPRDYGRNEPGFVALADGHPLTPSGADALPGSAAVNFTLSSFTVGSATDTLFYWSGAGPVDFQPASAVQPAVTMSLDPTPLGTTAADGSLHEHAAFVLDDGGAGVPLDGLYLISPSVGVSGLAASRPFYMIWLVDQLLTDDDSAETLEEALESDNPVYLDKNFGFVHEAFRNVQDTLVVPEPCTGVSALIGLLAATAILPRVRQQSSR